MELREAASLLAHLHELALLGAAVDPEAVNLIEDDLLLLNGVAELYSVLLPAGDDAQVVADVLELAVLLHRVLVVDLEMAEHLLELVDTDLQELGRSLPQEGKLNQGILGEAAFCCAEAVLNQESLGDFVHL